MMRDDKQGISDLTTSEGYLRRFTLISKLIHLARASGLPDIIPLVRRETGLTKTGEPLTNAEVIRRHLRIMSYIGVLSSPDEGYKIASNGKALTQLVGEGEVPISNGELTQQERVFYFVSLFRSIFSQLYLVLLTLFESNDKSREDLIVDYFTRVLDRRLRIWSYQQINEDIDKYNRRGELPTKFKNRFECMSMWLSQLGLIGRDITLTSIGKEFTNHTIHLVEHQQKVPGNFYGIATIYVNGLVHSLPRFSFEAENHELNFMHLFNEAYKLFETPDLQMSDARAMRTYISIKMLLHHDIIFEEQDFDDAIKQLANKRLIRSAMSGRNGKLAYIKVV